LKKLDEVVTANWNNLTDFGLSSEDGERPELEGIGTTPAFAAPEQLFQDIKDHKLADIHGLGMIFYYMLRGELGSNAIYDAFPKGGLVHIQEEDELTNPIIEETK
jgi:serine/threonine protein kinase